MRGRRDARQLKLAEQVVADDRVRLASSQAVRRRRTAQGFEERSKIGISANLRRTPVFVRTHSLVVNRYLVKETKSKNKKKT